jgi:hypothetical protein
MSFLKLVSGTNHKRKPHGDWNGGTRTHIQGLKGPCSVLGYRFPLSYVPFRIVAG